MAVAIYTTLLTLDEAPSGTVTVQNAGTTTPRAIYTDTSLTTPATNPIPLDSAGRAEQGILYTAATAYKVIVKDSAGGTIYTRDNIDPGVPVGSGFLAIANGGTGATTAGTALANLGGATAAELADVAAEVAAVTGALGSIEKTSIAKGSNAQRPASPATSDIRYNTDGSKYEAYQSGGWENFVLSGDAATQAQMEAASSTTTFVSPGRAQNHPGVAKMWAFVTVTAGTPAVTASHNVTSVTDNGTGNYTLNLTTAFSSANFAVVAMPYINGDANLFTWECSAKSASTITLKFYKATSGGNASQANIDMSFFAVAFGDQ